MDNRLGQRGRRWRGRQGNWLGTKLGGKLKSSSVELLSRRNVGAVSWSGAETEENPEEVMVPVSGGAAGGFETVVEGSTGLLDWGR